MHRTRVAIEASPVFSANDVTDQKAAPQMAGAAFYFGAGSGAQLISPQTLSGDNERSCLIVWDSWKIFQNKDGRRGGTTI